MFTIPLGFNRGSKNPYKKKSR